MKKPLGKVPGWQPRRRYSASNSSVRQTRRSPRSPGPHDGISWSTPPSLVSAPPTGRLVTAARRPGTCPSVPRRKGEHGSRTLRPANHHASLRAEARGVSSGRRACSREPSVTSILPNPALRTRSADSQGGPKVAAGAEDSRARVSLAVTSGWPVTQSGWQPGRASRRPGGPGRGD
jgi:hypothetical protein